MKPVRWLSIALTLSVSAVADPCAAAESETEVLEAASAACVATAKRVLPGVVAITTTKEATEDAETEGLSLEDLPEPVEGERANGRSWT